MIHTTKRQQKRHKTATAAARAASWSPTAPGDAGPRRTGEAARREHVAYQTFCRVARCGIVCSAVDLIRSDHMTRKRGRAAAARDWNGLLKEKGNVAAIHEGSSLTRFSDSELNLVGGMGN